MYGKVHSGYVLGVSGVGDTSLGQPRVRVDLLWAAGRRVVSTMAFITYDNSKNGPCFLQMAQRLLKLTRLG